MRRHLLLTCFLLPLAACVEPTTDRADPISWVEGVSARDAAQITVVIADILANSFDARQSTLSVRPATGPASPGVDVLLADTLRERGFALAPDGMAYPGSHTVIYAITPLYSSVMLRLDVDDAHATCMFTRGLRDDIQATTPCTVQNSAAVTLRPAVNITPTASPPAPVWPVGVAHSPAPGPFLASPASVHAVPLPPISASPLPAPARGPLPLAPAPVVAIATRVVAAPLPPPPPPVPKQIWTLLEGQPVRAQVEAWGSRAGWNVRWDSPRNWMVPVTTPFPGSFKEAVTAIIRAAAAQGVDIRARFYDPNTTLVITSPGAHAGTTP